MLIGRLTTVGWHGQFDSVFRTFLGVESGDGAELAIRSFSGVVQAHLHERFRLQLITKKTNI